MKNLLKSISGSEWRLVIFLVLVMIIITNLPLVYGWLITPPAKVFTGIHFAMPNDWFVYYSHLEQAAQGRWLFTDLFASEPHQPVLNTFWLPVGLFGRIFQLAPIITFNLFKIFLTPILYFVAYLFLADLFSEVRQRQIGLLMFSFASGAGIFLTHYFIVYPVNVAVGHFHWPMDLWLPEFSSFSTVSSSPHFIAALTLILFIFLLTRLFLKTQKISYSFAAGFSSLLLLSFHPFQTLTIFGVTSIYFVSLALINRKIIWAYWRHLLIMVLFSLPAVIYYFYLFQVDFVWRQKSWQNFTPTTPLGITLVSYGLLPWLAAAGWYFLVKNNYFKNINPENKWFFLTVWLVVQSLLIYAPVNWQRRMVMGLNFPLVIFSTIGLFSLNRWLCCRSGKLAQVLFFRRLIFSVVGCLLVSSSLFLFAVDLLIYRNQSPLAYVDQSVIAAIQWFKTIDSDKIIFNADDRGVNLIPAYAGRRVYVGHGVETPDYLAKQQAVTWFFSRNRSEMTEKSFLLKRQISYVFYGPLEKSLGSYDPESKAYLKKVYANNLVQIYQVL